MKAQNSYMQKYCEGERGKAYNGGVYFEKEKVKEDTLYL